MAQAGWTLHDLPIPPDVAPDRYWTGQMLEMADHIGAYATLLIVERFGGHDLYIPAVPTPKIVETIGPEKAAILCSVYACNRITIPAGRAALDRARRAPIIALARKGDITIAHAAKKARVTRRFMSRLVNHSDEGEQLSNPALPAAARSPRQIEMFEVPDED